MQKCLIYRSALVSSQALRFELVQLVHIYSLFFIYPVARHKNKLSNCSLITIFSAILIFLKTLQNDEGRQQTV